MRDSKRATWVVAGGRTRSAGEPLNVAPEFASNYYLPTDNVYSRSDGTRTSRALEELVGGLEGGRALAFSTGMAAASAVLHGLDVGAHVVVPPDPYHGVAGLIDEGADQGRWTVTRLDQADTDAWVATFATPLNQQPLDYGADVVMHSATKFLGGHSDLLAGVLITRDASLQDEYHHRRLLYGGTIGAMEAFLTSRGIRTLSLRMERAQENAMELARRLEQHPEVAVVRYPGLESHSTHDVAASFMADFGAMMSFDPTGPGERAGEVCARTELIHHATSLGGVESTMERRAVIEGQETMPPSLIRFSVGCEDVEDLWTDLDSALVSTRAL